MMKEERVLSHRRIQTERSGRGLQLSQLARESALPPSSGVPVNRPGARNPVEDSLDLSVLGLSLGKVLGLNGGQEGLDLSLDSTLPPVVQRAALGTLTDSLLGRFGVRHEASS